MPDTETKGGDIIKPSYDGLDEHTSAA